MKRIVSLLLTLLMIGSMLVGCVNIPEIPEAEIPEIKDEEPGTKEDATEITDEPTEETEPETDPEPKPEPKPEPEPEPEPEPKPEPEPEPEPELPPYGTKVGERFMDLTLTDINGNSVNTADLRGKIIVFNAWATWCPPCIGELPDFNKVASEYAEDVVIIAVHTYDDGMYNMPSYVESNFPDTKIIFAYDTPHSEGYIAAGGTRYVPQTAIVNKDGIIVYSNAGALSHSTLVQLIEANK